VKTIAAVLPPGVRVPVDSNGRRLELRDHTSALLDWDGSRATARVRVGGGEGKKGTLYTVPHEELARHSGWFARAVKDAGGAP
jgi:hypothetical protein